MKPRNFQRGLTFAQTTLLTLILILIPASTLASDYNGKIERDFHLGVEDSRLEVTVIQLSMSNDALIYFQCKLYANSTNNATLVVHPESVWNVTQIRVTTGKDINATVTNGDQGLDPDVFSPFNLIIQRESITDEVWGNLSVTILTRGWKKTVSPIIPGVFGLLFVWIIRKRKAL